MDSASLSMQTSARYAYGPAAGGMGGYWGGVTGRTGQLKRVPA